MTCVVSKVAVLAKATKIDFTSLQKKKVTKEKSQKILIL
jgi:hypothetical protein